MNDYLRLKEAPALIARDPYCSTCQEDAESTGDGYLCPSCGTSWDYSDIDSPGELYAAWSGEEPGGPAVEPHEAWQVSHLHGDDRAWHLARMRGEQA